MKDLVNSLPDDLRKRIGDFFNWNTVLIKGVEDELHKSYLIINEYKENIDPQHDFGSFKWSLEWWLHLLKTDGRSNWRLKNTGDKLLEQMEDLNLNNLANVFAELLEYNKDLFQKPPGMIL